MAAQLALKTSDFEARAISPLLEMGAYEALWLRDKASFKTIADLFRVKYSSCFKFIIRIICYNKSLG